MCMVKHHKCPMKGPSALVKERSKHPWRLTEWARYMEAVRSSKFYHFCSCGCCGKLSPPPPQGGKRDAGRRVDPHPWFDPCLRDPKIKIGMLRWVLSWGGGEGENIVLRASVVRTITMPTIKRVIRCRHCREKSKLPRYLPVAVCRGCHPSYGLATEEDNDGEVGEWTAISHWVKCGPATYRPYHGAVGGAQGPPRCGVGPGPGPGGESARGPGVPLGKGVIIKPGMARFFRDRYKYVVSGGDWLWVDPPIPRAPTDPSSICPGCKLRELRKAPFALTPEPWTKRRRIFGGAQDTGDAMGGIRLEPPPEPPLFMEDEGDFESSPWDDDVFDESMFNICFLCQNIGSWDIYKEVPSVHVMDRYMKTGITTNIPICVNCITDCEACGEHPAIASMGAKRAICNKCHWKKQSQEWEN